MFIKTFPVGAFQCNCTVIADEETGQAMVIDPGDEIEKILDQIQFDVKYIIHTHAHIDHIGATKALHQKQGGEICLHKEDLPLYENMAMQAQLLGVDMDCDVLPVQTYIECGDTLECSSNLRMNVVHTPGHTPGSVCFFLEKFLSTSQETPLLFSGDTLFMRSIGRTDLWGGDHSQILASIREKLFSLPPETVVIPGHGPQTCIGDEIQQNPFLS